MTEVTCSGPEMIALYQLVKGFLAYTFQQNYAQLFSSTVLSKAESFTFVENTCHVKLILPAQVNPSPSNGEVQVQLKAPLRGPSLVQTALESQGFDRQGSRTEKDEIKH